MLNAQRGDPDTVKNTLLSEEARLKESEVRNSRSRAFTMTSKGQSKGQGSSETSSKRKCFHCGKEGHFKKDCRKLKARKESNKESWKDSEKKDSKSGDDSKEEKLYLMAYHAVDRSTPLQKQWYLDSGASDHITGDLGAFMEFQEITPFPITLGDSSTVLVTGKGKVQLQLEHTIIEFTDVLYSQHFGATCLLSVPQLALKGASITFDRYGVQLKLNGSVVASGTLCRKTGLFKLTQKEALVYRLTVPHD